MRLAFCISHKLSRGVQGQPFEMHWSRPSFLKSLTDVTTPEIHGLGAGLGSDRGYESQIHSSGNRSHRLSCLSFLTEKLSAVPISKGGWED